MLLIARSPNSPTQVENPFYLPQLLYSWCVYIVFCTSNPSSIVSQIGSALSGAAQNITWLIACRAVQGLGGGGIIQLVVITISDIVPLQQ